MRHNKKFNHLGRTASHRKAMLSNMAASLILHKKIITTLAKAKELRTFVEPLITKSKKDDVHSRRTVFSYLQNKYAVKELFINVANKIADRPGGYTRILKTGNRLGDNAEMCLIELVDFNEALLNEKQAKKAKTTRRGRSKKTKDAEADVVKTKKTTHETSAKESKKVLQNEIINTTVEDTPLDTVEDTQKPVIESPEVLHETETEINDISKEEKKDNSDDEEEEKK